MSAPDTASDGLRARPLFSTMVVPPRRRRTFAQRLRMAVRHNFGMGVFFVMLLACGALVLLSRQA
ncbi:MAG: hypothetical protein KF889_09140 [Alphaproteobacteria bacterium]|nr:hypothetical protein [Alphaproteobacteria bacterium]MCW5740988.1 hypothetical protein [Alphaproteobacteria bacterium]